MDMEPFERLIEKAIEKGVRDEIRAASFDLDPTTGKVRYAFDIMVRGKGGVMTDLAATTPLVELMRGALENYMPTSATARSVKQVLAYDFSDEGPEFVKLQNALRCLL